MVLAGLIIAAIIDLAIAVLLVAVSGFVIGSGPESMHGGAAFTAGWIGAVVACLAAPAAGFVLRAKGKATAGVVLAFMPPLAALLATMIPAPY